MLNKTPALVNAHDGDVRTESLHTIKDGEMFVSRDAMRDQNQGGGLFKPARSLRYGLNISEDGKTATLTMSFDRIIMSNTTGNDDRPIGTVTVSQMSTLDLTKEIPEVTDVTFSQTYTEKFENAAPNQQPAVIHM